MESNEILETLECFDPDVDNTLNEIKVWKTAMSSIMQAHRTFATQLTEAMTGIRQFLAGQETEERQCVSRPAMDHLLGVVTHIASVQTSVWDHFIQEKGPFRKMETYADETFERLKARSERNKNAHMTLENQTEAERKLYQKRLDKWQALRDKLSKKLNKKFLEKDEKYQCLTSKVETSLTRYQSHFRKEVKHRHHLHRQVCSIKTEFCFNEMAKINMLFETITDLLEKLGKVAPMMTGDQMELIVPDRKEVEAMARARWASKLILKTFPCYRGPDDTDPMSPEKTEVTTKKKTKKPPVSLFTVHTRESRDKFLSPVDSSKKKPSSKKETSPDLGDSSNSSFEHVDPAGPNLEPMSFEDDVQISDSLKNCALIPEDEYQKPRRRLTFENKTDKDQGSCDILQKIWDDEEKRAKLERPLTQADSESLEKTLSKFVQNSETKDGAYDQPDTPVVPGCCVQMSSDDRQKAGLLHTERRLRGQVIRNTKSKSGYSVQNKNSDEKIDNVTSDTKVSSVEEIKLSNSFRTGRKRTPVKKAEINMSTSKPKVQISDSSSSEDNREKREVTVIALKDRLSHNSNEISIRAGMKIKQVREADEDGMAYGYKRNKFGLKKFGLYPADLVTLYHTRNITDGTNRE